MNRSELYSRIAARLDEIGRTPGELMDHLTMRGIRYDLAWIEVFVQPDDIYPIAEFLQEKPSFLFFATPFKDHLFRSLIDEIWHEYKDRIGCTKAEAVRSVISGEHRQANSLETLEQEIRLALDQLCPVTFSKPLNCQYPDCVCERLGLKCPVTGFMLGPEG